MTFGRHPYAPHLMFRKNDVKKVTSLAVRTVRDMGMPNRGTSWKKAAREICEQAAAATTPIEELQIDMSRVFEAISRNATTAEREKLARPWKQHEAKFSDSTTRSEAGITPEATASGERSSNIFRWTFGESRACVSVKSGIDLQSSKATSTAPIEPQSGSHKKAKSLDSSRNSEAEIAPDPTTEAAPLPSPLDHSAPIEPQPAPSDHAAPIESQLELAISPEKSVTTTQTLPDLGSDPATPLEEATETAETVSTTTPEAVETPAQQHSDQESTPAASLDELPVSKQYPTEPAIEVVTEEIATSAPQSSSLSPEQASVIPEEPETPTPDQPGPESAHVSQDQIRPRKTSGIESAPISQAQSGSQEILDVSSAAVSQEQSRRQETAETESTLVSQESGHQEPLETVSTPAAQEQFEPQETSVTTLAVVSQEQSRPQETSETVSAQSSSEESLESSIQPQQPIESEPDSATPGASTHEPPFPQPEQEQAAPPTQEPSATSVTPAPPSPSVTTAINSPPPSKLQSALNETDAHAATAIQIATCFKLQLQEPTTTLELQENNAHQAPTIQPYHPSNLHLQEVPTTPPALPNPYIRKPPSTALFYNRGPGPSTYSKKKLKALHLEEIFGDIWDVGGEGGRGGDC